MSARSRRRHALRVLMPRRAGNAWRQAGEYMRQPLIMDGAIGSFTVFTFITSHPRLA